MPDVSIGNFNITNKLSLLLYERCHMTSWWGAIEAGTASEVKPSGNDDI